MTGGGRCSMVRRRRVSSRGRVVRGRVLGGRRLFLLDLIRETPVNVNHTCAHVGKVAK